MINKVIKIIKNPKLLLYYLDKKNLIRLDDKEYIKLLYKIKTGQELNLDNPTTYNEKIQWLKLNDRNHEYTKMADKYEMKKYVSTKLGDGYVIPTIGIYNNFSEIDFDKLPSKFVIKCTHDSGGLVIVKNKENMNINKIKKIINKSLKRNYYSLGREWPYKNIKPRIIIEQFMDNNNQELIDYKFFCFNGKAKIILCCSERFSSKNMCETWFDEEWNLLNIIESGHRIDKTLKKPTSFERMKEISEILSNDIPFLRVDFYEINSQPYIGELTFYPASGFENFKPEDWNEKLGNMLALPKVKSK